MDIRKFFAKPAGAAKPAEAKVAVEKDPTPKKAKAPVTKAANEEDPIVIDDDDDVEMKAAAPVAPPAKASAKAATPASAKKTAPSTASKRQKKEGSGKKKRDDDDFVVSSGEDEEEDEGGDDDASEETPAKKPSAKPAPKTSPAKRKRASTGGKKGDKAKPPAVTWEVPESELRFSVMDPEAARTAAQSHFAGGGGGGGGGHHDRPPPARGTIEAPRGPENCLEGLTFVITGVGESLDREETESLVKRHGGRVTGSVSGKTSFLVVGMDSGSGKVGKARDLKTPLIDEKNLFALIRAQAEKAGFKADAGAGAGAGAAQQAATAGAGAGAAAGAAAAASKPAAAAAAAGGSGSGSGWGMGSGMGGGAGAGAGAARLSAPVAQRPPPPPPEHAGETALWVEKHKPRSSRDLIGNQGLVKQLTTWLQSWDRTFGPNAAAPPKGRDAPKRALLLSGPPGIGKTSAATIILRELGFRAVEVNASDSRNKAESDVGGGVGGRRANMVKELVTNTAVHFGEFGDKSSFGGGGARAAKSALVMDEVDGMSGGDRGGVQDLIDTIKRSKIPIICICNDRYSQKLKSLLNHVTELKFSRPTKQMIRTRLAKVAAEEGLRLSDAAVEALAEASGADIRLCLNQLQLMRCGGRDHSWDSVTAGAKKDQDLSPFSINARMWDAQNKLSINARLDLCFADADLIPLFVQENYINMRPHAAGNDEAARSSLLADAAEALSGGDVLNTAVRRSNRWGLMPYALALSCVAPTAIARGSRVPLGIEGEVNFPRFPGWLGKNSTSTKMKNLLAALSARTRASGTCLAGRTVVRLEYAPVLRWALTRPMWDAQSGGLDREGVRPVVDLMREYGLTREDWDTVRELSALRGDGPAFRDAAAGVATATKTAFTRECTKELGKERVHAAKKKKKGGGGAAAEAEEADDDEEEEEGADGAAAGVPAEEEEEEPEAAVLAKRAKGLKALRKHGIEVEEKGGGSGSGAKGKGGGGAKAAGGKGKGAAAAGRGAGGRGAGGKGKGKAK